jgi:hypothetical protein
VGGGREPLKDPDNLREVNDRIVDTETGSVQERTPAETNDGLLAEQPNVSGFRGGKPHTVTRSHA